jgi:Mn-dependent DtxR family transcriptional regulator
MTNQDISARFNLAKSSTSDYLKTLFDDNILEFHQDGKFKRCYVKQDARMILLRYKPQ